MITSAPDAIALHEAAVSDMWNRSLKGQAAADCLRDMLANEGKPLGSEQVTKWMNAAGKRRRSRG
jgi:hypothetical protein